MHKMFQPGVGTKHAYKNLRSIKVRRKRAEAGK
jgi:hypothetical protein